MILKGLSSDQEQNSELRVKNHQNFFARLSLVMELKNMYRNLLLLRMGKSNCLTSQKEIEGEVYGFYRNLFSCRDNDIDGGSIQEFLGTEIIQTLPKLTPDQRESMNGPLTLSELTNYLKKTLRMFY